MASMRFGTLQLCDEHACKSATKTSTEVAHFYAATWTHFTLRLTPPVSRKFRRNPSGGFPARFRGAFRFEPRGHFVSDDPSEKIS